MAKKTCVICDKKLGVLSGKVAISDGFVCSSCLKRAGAGCFSNGQAYNTSMLIDFFNDRAPIVNSFSATKKIGRYIEIDEVHKYFKIQDSIFEYANLLSFELLEDGQTITKGGLGRAVVGGLLFGGVGAVVGGVTGRKKAKGVCNSMKIRVTLKNTYTDSAYITFIESETKKNSIIYKDAQDNAQSCISALEIIVDQNQHSKMTETATQTNISAADEIMKFKHLLDEGIITQEEFDAEKRKLLGF